VEPGAPEGALRAAAMKHGDNLRSLVPGD